MKTYQSFFFDFYSVDPKTGRIELKYKLDDEIQFTEVLELPTPFALHSSPSLDAALFALHLAGGTSYFKTCCPKNIQVLSGKLNKNQTVFWNTVYENGLGEFFYQNTIDFRELINFPVSNEGESTINPPAGTLHSTSKTLVPIGGGKDSLVTIEKLRKEGHNITLLRMGAHPLIDAIVQETGLPCLSIKRKLPRKLFELNEQGALNGHIPITAYLSCLSVVVANAYGFDAIALSNEKSADIGNTKYLGKEINHQWSKSKEFEEMFTKYIHTNINPGIKYWSPLRQMTELEVVGEFVQYPQYFSLFTSCNRNWNIAGETQKKRWCNNCPKCAFVYVLLAAYLPRITLLKIFGENLFEKESLIPLYKQLLGIEGCKPFECVGSPEETCEAFAHALKRGEHSGTPIMQMYVAAKAFLPKA